MQEFKIQDGEQVVIMTAAFTFVGLKPGAFGTIFAVFATYPQQYEVLYIDKRNGNERTMVLDEREIAGIDSSAPNFFDEINNGRKEK